MYCYRNLVYKLVFVILYGNVHIFHQHEQESNKNVKRCHKKKHSYKSHFQFS